jgi:tRNA (adenine-N(1)-)-methyltransferase non-catalytic subunit
VRNREVRLAKIKASKALLLEANFDSLIVCGRPHPTPIVLGLIDYVLPSRPVSVFCQHLEPLIDCYMKLRDRSGVANLRLTETWWRNYQVLPNRTHPEINMHNKSGFLLTGITTTIDS